jgi:hypothetical protein
MIAYKLAASGIPNVMNELFVEADLDDNWTPILDDRREVSYGKETP